MCYLTMIRRAWKCFVSDAERDSYDYAARRLAYSVYPDD